MKNNTYKDITKTVLSEKDTRKLMVKIFPDAIILDNNFQIFSVCENLCKTLGYFPSELQNTNFQDLLIAEIEIESIKLKLTNGHFDKYPIKIKNKNGSDLLFVVSGFYLGLISDFNDLIVIKLQNMEELKKVKTQLEAKMIEMDDFIYHSAHSLRGPLATLKGLIGLSKITHQKEEIDILTSKMEQYADCLDDKLSTLLKFAGFENEEEKSLIHYTYEYIFIYLNSIFATKLDESDVELKNLFSNPESRIDKGKIVLEILTHLVSFLLKQDKKPNSVMLLDGAPNKAFFELNLHTIGFNISKETKSKLENANFGYVEILNETQFAGLYTAKKFLQKINGSCKMTFSEQNEVTIQLTIPKVFYNPTLANIEGVRQFHVLR